MNYFKYEIRGRHFETKRVRTLKVDAFSEDDAKLQAQQAGLESFTSINIIPFDEPTENQLQYATNLDIAIPLGATKEDVSALISKHVDEDGTPNEGLYEFATAHRVLASKYIGKTALYNRVFNSLSDSERIAFFIFSIYRFISDDRHANLDTHHAKELFYQFARSKEHDEQFLRSMNKYSGNDLKYFGNLTMPSGWSVTGGSVDTIAFKNAREFLLDYHLINESQPYRSKNLQQVLLKDTQSPNETHIETRIDSNSYIKPITKDYTNYWKICAGIVLLIGAIYNFFIK